MQSTSTLNTGTEITFYYLVFVLAPVIGYESIWFCGDDFGHQTFNDYYLNRMDDFRGYAKDNFEVIGFMSDSATSDDLTLISRLRNILVEAITKQVLLPKIIVFVPDDDIIVFLNYAEYGIFKCLGRIVNWIMREHNRIIESYKEYLPLKAKKYSYTQLHWIQAPTHDNFNNNLMQQKFNYALSTQAQNHEHTWALQLKKVWDPHNHSLFKKEDNEYTVEGIKTYWEAVDKMLKYADTILLKKPNKPKASQSLIQERQNLDTYNKRESSPSRDRPSNQHHNRWRSDTYHWNRLDKDHNRPHHPHSHSRDRPDRPRSHHATSTDNYRPQSHSREYTDFDRY